MSKLVTNGCSMTWGWGINSDRNIGGGVDAYPYKLAKLLDAELFDLSKPGESCNYVVRTTIDFFLERLDEDLSEYIVILQLPDGNRFEYWNDDKKKLKWKAVMPSHDDNKDLAIMFGSQKWNFYNTANNIMQIGNFLKDNNIRYYISTGGQDWTSGTYNEEISKDKKIKRRIEYIETNYSILGGSFSKSRLTQEVPAEEVRLSKEDPHWSVDGHTIIANNIYRLIND